MRRYLISFVEECVLIPTGTVLAILFAVWKFDDGMHIPTSIAHPTISVLLGALLFIFLTLLYWLLKGWMSSKRLVG